MSNLNFEPIILQHFGDNCVYCGKSLENNDALYDRQLDHIIPRSAGGGNHLGNFVPCCRACNFKKMANPPNIPIQLPLPLPNKMRMFAKVFKANKKSQ